MMANLMRGAPRARPRDLFSFPVPEAGGQTLGDISDSLVQHSNMLQSELNRVLGRVGNGPELSIDNVLQLL
jgi:hypothetical protein